MSQSLRKRSREFCRYEETSFKSKETHTNVHIYHSHARKQQNTHTQTSLTTTGGEARAPVYQACARTRYTTQHLSLGNIPLWHKIPETKIIFFRTTFTYTLYYVDRPEETSLEDIHGHSSPHCYKFMKTFCTKNVLCSKDPWYKPR